MTAGKRQKIRAKGFMRRLSRGTLLAALMAMIWQAGGTNHSSYALALPTTPLLPSCGSNDTPFLVSPLALSDIIHILPLGNLAPPDHTFPTRHLYFHISRENPEDFASEVPVSSPGDVWITEISSVENLDMGTADFSIQFSPCREIKAYFIHLVSLAQTIASEFVAPYDNCEEYTTGGDQWRACSKEVHIALSAGESLGTAGGPGLFALDFGAADGRTPPLQYANPARWQQYPFQLHVVCAIDYFTPEVQDSLLSLLGDLDTARTVEPICGEVEQDEPDTVQGIWFVQETTQPFPEDPHLALVHDNVEPSEGVFSIGTSMSNSGLASGLYYFTPTSSGFINRDFNEVSTDGNIYCYEPRDRWSETPLPSTIILLQLLDPTTLRIEKQDFANCPSSPWAFGSTYTDFER